MTSDTAPVAREPVGALNASSRYDRQIRVWHEHGQAALERASVCVIGAGPTGTETLKNLVLPGIGAFTIVDGATVCESDVGNNFFLPREGSASATASNNPSNRAAASASALLELNDRVDGAYVPDDPSSFLSDAAGASTFFRRFSLVIATQLGVGSPVMQMIAAGCRDANIPLLAVRSYGLIGTIRVQIPEFCVLDAHEDSPAPDLRLHRPFSALTEFVDSIDLPAITDSTIAAHVPFIVLLVKALTKFRASHEDNLPSSRAEKNVFGETVKSLRPAVCPEFAENMEEALKFANLRLCFGGSADFMSDDLARVLADPRGDPSATVAPKSTSPPEIRPGMDLPSLPSPISLSNRNQDPSPRSTVASDVLADEMSSFWLHVAAVRSFIAANDGQLPLNGVVPDMTADTMSYVTLQRLYASKAESDAAEVLQHAVRVAEQRGESCPCDEQSVKDFCKRLAGIRVLRYRSMEHEFKNVGASGVVESIEMTGASDPTNPNSAMAYYVLMQAVDVFHAEHKRYPGDTKGSEDDDARLLRDGLSEVKSGLGGAGCLATPSLWCDETDEVVRFAGGELHNVASFMGGVAAQEAVKIITRQFVPINNTMVVNFANMTSASFTA
jgi:NEDD8-activating enzyme E1 regulatory subunit